MGATSKGREGGREGKREGRGREGMGQAKISQHCTMLTNIGATLRTIALTVNSWPQVKTEGWLQQGHFFFTRPDPTRPTSL